MQTQTLFPFKLIICFPIVDSLLSFAHSLIRSFEAYTNFKSYFKCFSALKQPCQIIVFASSNPASRVCLYESVENVIPLPLHSYKSYLFKRQISKVLELKSFLFLCLPVFREERLERGRETQSAINNKAIGNNNKMPFEFNLFIIHWQVFIHAIK